MRPGRRLQGPPGLRGGLEGKPTPTEQLGAGEEASGGGAWEEAVGERHRARAPVACAGDFEWLQVAGAKSTCPGVGTAVLGL